MNPFIDKRNKRHTHPFVHFKHFITDKGKQKISICDTKNESNAGTCMWKMHQKQLLRKKLLDQK